MTHRMRILPGIVGGLCLATLSACGPVPSDSAYASRGGPESLIDVSSEVVNLGVSGPGELNELSNWIARDQPTRAELYCSAGEPRCTEAQKVLDLHGVPSMLVPSPNYSVTLVYERILARDCNPSYLDDSKNYYEAPHAAFGCAVSANMVQHVSDKQQFVSPNLSDDPLARRAVTDFRRAYVARPNPTPYTIDQSPLQQIGQQ